MRNHRKHGNAQNRGLRSSRATRTHDRRRPALPATSGLLAALFTGSLLAATPAQATPAPEDCVPASEAPDKRQMRAEWVASVHNIDWPSRPGLSAESQKAELTRLYDEAASYGLNAVFVQIRPTADAFWPSPHEPWSQWLTGQQGTHPGYDPLEFAVSEAHKRNLEFHGWFNPYRVAMHGDIDRLAAGHPARQNRDWVFEYGGRLYYDPGIPEVRTFVQDAMMHAVENYDMDGVHFDDYFYPYPAGGEGLPDSDTFARYGGDFDNIHDWRRNNVDLLVQEMNDRIAAAAPHMKFGISPFGIWRNADTDPNGSDTSGFQSYDEIYADTRTWVLEGWLDYVNPQVYWEIGHSAADYAALVPWWADLVDGTGVQLYIGQAAYKVGDSGPWRDPAELSRHLTFNRNYPQVDGDVYFSATSLRNNAAEARRILTDGHYAHPALVPVKEDLGGAAPEPPVVTDATRTGDSAELTIKAAPGSEPAYYAVYRFDGEPAPEEQVCRLADPRTMAGTVRSDGTTTTFTVSGALSSQTYYVTALDRLHHESEASQPKHLP